MNLIYVGNLQVILMIFSFSEKNNFYSMCFWRIYQTKFQYFFFCLFHAFFYFGSFLDIGKTVTRQRFPLLKFHLFCNLFIFLPYYLKCHTYSKEVLVCFLSMKLIILSVRRLIGSLKASTKVINITE
jgi:hypothetical protein